MSIQSVIVRVIVVFAFTDEQLRDSQ